MPRVWIAGHNGMLGRALVRQMPKPVEALTCERDRLDLTDRNSVFTFIQNQRPDAIMVAAGRVGGIAANIAAPTAFLTENLHIALNCIEGAHQFGIKKLVYFGSACVYPSSIAQPMSVDDLWAGALEKTNRAYALAKLAGTELASEINRSVDRQYATLMPCNLYGPFDKFDPKHSHVIPALIMKFVRAKMLNETEVQIWGDGAAHREFMHVDDCARAAWHVFKNDAGQSVLNVGTGEETSICSLAKRIANIVGFKGELVFQTDKPVGAHRRLLDSSQIKELGWRPKMSLQKGLEETIDWYVGHKAQAASSELLHVPAG